MGGWQKVIEGWESRFKMEVSDKRMWQLSLRMVNDD